MTTGAGNYYFLGDAQGSTANLTSSTGATEWTYSYEHFGASRIATKNDPSAPENMIRFTGQMLDATSQAYNLRAREYDPATGRLLQRDPVVPDVGSPFISSYVYANDRPSVLVDPSGLWTVGICGHLTWLGVSLGGCIQFGNSGVGFSGTIQNATSGGGFSAAAGVQVTNAQCLQDLGGPFVGEEASTPPLPWLGGLSAQGSGFTGGGRVTGNQVTGGEIGVGGGLGGAATTFSYTRVWALGSCNRAQPPTGAPQK
jgi:RHS repeat-associated protein